MKISRPATLCAALLLVLAVWEIAVLWRAKAGAPADDDWRAAHNAVAALHTDGDLIVFAPAWDDPVGRLWLGDLMKLDEVARAAATRYPRVWEVSIRGARAAEATGTLAYDESFGAVRVRRYDRPAPRVVWDLRAKAQLREVDFAPRLCVPFRPPMVLKMDSLAAAKSLQVFAGIADFRSRRENKARAILTVSAGGSELTRASIGNDSNWLTLPPASLPSGTTEVVFDAKVDPAFNKGAGGLDLCIAAEAYE